MKKTNKLNKLLESLLLEDVPEAPPKNMQDFSPNETPVNVSLDQAVDRYIIRYEKESIPTATTYEKQLGAMQNQQPQEKQPPQVNPSPQSSLETMLERILNEAEDTGLDLGAADDTSGGDEGASIDDIDQDTQSQQPVISTPQINLQDFTRSIARLVNNYDALLNPKEIIINRVKEYIKTNYDARTAQEFSEILMNNYSLSSASDKEAEEDNWPTPYTVGALSSEG